MASKSTSKSPPTPFPLTSKVPLQLALPPLSFEPNYHTTSKALHDIHFTGLLEPWDSFETEVLAFRPAIDEKYDIENILGYASSNPSAHDIMLSEHFRCGEEISIAGRFVANALHVVSAISRDVELTTVFGDWKATEKKETSKEIGRAHV